MGKRVQATTIYDWSYKWTSGGVLAGTLEGTLQGDLNTIVIADIQAVYIPSGGTGFIFDPAFMGSTLSAPNFSAFVTLDGSAFSLWAGDLPSGLPIEFLLHTSINTAKLWNPPDPDPNNGPSLVIEEEGISPSDNSWVASEHWSISEQTQPVPEPATIALLGIGLVGLAGAEVRRRRKKKAVNNS